MRIRSIKPEFWTSESLGRLDRDARLIFIGLWSLADDAGRFRADPRYIAGQLLPYDEDGLASVRRALASLSAEGCVLLYEANRSSYGLITGWKRHQKIDKPSQSRIPEPPEISLANPRECSPKPRERSWEDQGSGIRDQGEDQGTGSEEPVAPADASAPPPPILEPKATAPEKPPHVLQQIWNDHRGKLSEWRETSDARRAKADARWKEFPDRDRWKRVVQRMSSSAFCRGEKSDGWKAGPDFFLQPDTGPKVLEGKYDDRPNPAARATAPPAPPRPPCARCSSASVGELWGHAICGACEAAWRKLQLSFDTGDEWRRAVAGWVTQGTELQ